MNYAVAAVTGFEIAYTRMTIHESWGCNISILLRKLSGYWLCMLHYVYHA